jgi:hypothetical protein
MRTVQTVLDFFFETPQAYFCDRCGECHRAGECKAVEKRAPREPKEGEKRADEFKEEATPRKPKEKRKSRIHRKKRKRSSRSLRARRGRDGVRRPGLKTGISGMMRARLYEGGLDLPYRTHRPAEPRG